MQIFIRKSLKILLILAIISACAVITLFTIFSLTDSLNKTEKVNANLLVIEGWLPDNALIMVYEEIKKNNYEHIITTGLNLPDYFELNMNGFLVFYSKPMHSKSNGLSQHIIEVDCYSNMADEYKAHMNLFMNDSLVADLFVEKKKNRYKIPWYGDLSKVDSIMIQFDNDDLGEWGDINLLVKGITIDKTIDYKYQLNSIYDIRDPNGKGRIHNDFTSYSETTRDKLIGLGVDPNFISAVPGHKTVFNRTLSSVKAFQVWLKDSGLKIKGINIVSVGKHSRRSYMIYRKILGKNYNIGIISLPDNKTHKDRKEELLKTLRETLGIVYYWIILIPW